MIPRAVCVKAADGPPPANDTELMGADSMAAWQRAWLLLPEAHRRTLLAAAQTILVVAATPRRRRSSVRAPDPAESLDPDAVLRAQAMFRRHTGVAT